MSKFKDGDMVYSIASGVGVVRTTTTYVDSKYPIVVDITEPYGTYVYTAEGKAWSKDVNPTLLTLEEAKAKGYDVPKQKITKTRTGWINVYKIHVGDRLYYTAAGANSDAAPGRIACVPVTYEYEVEE
jgi:hypothetical protein